jgi:hypothetical protein
MFLFLMNLPPSAHAKSAFSLIGVTIEIGMDCAVLSGIAPPPRFCGKVISARRD